MDSDLPDVAKLPVSLTIKLEDAAATEHFGRRLAGALQRCPARRLVIFLQGDLGAGKTTFSRGFLRGLGHQGRVPSPTYTLIEPYELSPLPVYHMDLYRLQDGAELEFLGLDDLPEPLVLLIEWPERAAVELGEPDLRLSLAFADQGRKLQLEALSARSAKLLSELQFVQ
jgi:tRNA threonylcarbamoyladenosine biosynthesis protein TsaE